MRRVVRLWVSSWLLIAGVVPSAAQEIARDRVPPPRVGTAAIKGRVVDGLTGTAVARARVRLQGPAQQPSVVTDATGGFVFANLPAGGYMIAAEKSTYLPANYPERGRTIRAAARPVALSDGQTETLTVPIYHGGAIAGRVVDASGDPVEFAQVSVLRGASGRSGRLTQTNGTQTNDLGEFRIARLEPGRYIVQVSWRRPTYDEPGADKQALPQQPLPTFYPNALSPDQAEVIAIDRGQTISGLDVMLAEGTPTLVTGTVVGADGQPVTTGASVNFRRIATNVMGFSDGSGTGVRPDGTFRLAVAPGEYSVEAYASAPPSTTRDGPVAAGAVQNQRLGFMKVAVAGTSLDVGTIVVAQGATVAGRFVFDGTSPLPSPAETHLMLFAGDVNCRVPETKIDADWRFRIEGLHGTCAGANSFMLGRWMLKAVMHNGENLLDTRTTFGPGQQLRNLEVVFTDRRSEMTFTVADDRGQATRNYVVIVFSPDKSQWGEPSSFVRTFAPPSIETMTLMRTNASVGTSGRPGTMAAPPLRETLSGLRPTDYLVVAVDDIAYDETRDPAIVERLASRATRVTIADGASVEVPLRRHKLADVMKDP